MGTSKWLHIVLLISTVMVLACRNNWFGSFAHETLWEERLKRQLIAAWRQFQHWLVSKGIDCSQPEFSMTMFCMKTLASIHFFKSNAHSCTVVSDWLMSVYEAQASEDLELKMICPALWAFNSWMRTAHQCGQRGTILLTDAEV